MNAGTVVFFELLDSNLIQDTSDTVTVAVCIPRTGGWCRFMLISVQSFRRTQYSAVSRRYPLKYVQLSHVRLSSHLVLQSVASISSNSVFNTQSTSIGTGRTSTGAPSSPTQTAGGNHGSAGHSSTNVGAIVGGVLGGIALILLFLLGLLLIRRNRAQSPGTAEFESGRDGNGADSRVGAASGSYAVGAGQRTSLSPGMQQYGTYSNDHNTSGGGISGGYPPEYAAAGGVVGAQNAFPGDPTNFSYAQAQASPDGTMTTTSGNTSTRPLVTNPAAPSMGWTGLPEVQS